MSDALRLISKNANRMSKVMYKREHDIRQKRHITQKRQKIRIELELGLGFGLGFWSEQTLELGLGHLFLSILVYVLWLFCRMSFLLFIAHPHKLMNFKSQYLFKGEGVDHLCVL